MRGIEEVGCLRRYSKDVNEAYRTYASAYLDCVDDNLGNFLWHGHDLQPIMNVSEKDEQAIVKAYLDAATEIVMKTIKTIRAEKIKKLYPKIANRFKTA